MTQALEEGRREGPRRGRAESQSWLGAGEIKLLGGGGEPVDLRRTLASHGVASLPPQLLDVEAGTLRTTLALAGRPARTVRLLPRAADLVAVEAWGSELGPGEGDHILGALRTILGLDDDLTAFYRMATRDPGLAWVALGAGRMLRGLTVFEDVVKTICTTNCAWSATVRMVTTLVGELGEQAADGGRAFPEPRVMAEAGEVFYRERVRAGYRGPYLLSLAKGVATGELDLERFRDPALPDDEVESRLLALPGVGPYAAAHIMLTSLGRYRRLVLDSWTRPTYAALLGRRASDRTIARRFRRFGNYAGLAFWLHVTRDWVSEEPDGRAPGAG